MLHGVFGGIGDTLGDNRDVQGFDLLEHITITENLRLKLDFRVETKSSETPPPSAPDIRQLTRKAEEVRRRFLDGRRC